MASSTRRMLAVLFAVGLLPAVALTQNVTNIDSGAGFSSLGAAIDDPGTLDGHRLHINASFTEPPPSIVDVTKDVEIEGVSGAEVVLCRVNLSPGTTATLRGFTVDCNLTLAPGVTLESAAGNLQEMKVLAAGGAGILVQGDSTLEMDGTSIEDCAGDGIVLDGCNATLNDCIIRGCMEWGIRQTSTPVPAPTAPLLDIHGGEIVLNGSGGLRTNYSGVPRIQLTGVTIRDSYAGPGIVLGTGATAALLVMNGSTISGCATHGIQTEETNQRVFLEEGCVVERCGLTGIHVGGEACNIALQGSTIRGNTAGAFPDGVGIFLAPGGASSEVNLLQGSLVDDNSGAGIAIFAPDARVEVDESEISGTRAGSDAGISVRERSAFINIRRSAMRRNEGRAALLIGGDAYLASVTIDQSTIEQNVCPAVAIVDGAGSGGKNFVTVMQSTLSGNELGVLVDDTVVSGAEVVVQNQSSILDSVDDGIRIANNASGNVVGLLFSQIERCGGDGIDMNAAGSGAQLFVQSSILRDFPNGNGVQMRGGSGEVLIDQGNTFEQIPGGHGVQIINTGAGPMATTVADSTFSSCNGAVQFGNSGGGIHNASVARCTFLDNDQAAISLHEFNGDSESSVAISQCDIEGVSAEGIGIALTNCAGLAPGNEPFVEITNTSITGDGVAQREGIRVQDATNLSLMVENVDILRPSRAGVRLRGLNHGLVASFFDVLVDVDDALDPETSNEAVCIGNADADGEGGVLHFERCTFLRGSSILELGNATNSYMNGQFEFIQCIVTDWEIAGLADNTGMNTVTSDTSAFADPEAFTTQPDKINVESGNGDRTLDALAPLFCSRDMTDSLYAHIGDNTIAFDIAGGGLHAGARPVSCTASGIRDWSLMVY